MKLSKTNTNQELLVLTKKKKWTTSLELANILYLKGDINYTNITNHVREEDIYQTIRASMTLKKLTELLSSHNCFLRIHKNTLINIDHITSVQQIANYRFRITTTDGIYHDVSRRSWLDFKNHIRTHKPNLIENLNSPTI